MGESLRILYLGAGSGTSHHRFQALRRLGHQVQLIDPWSFAPRNMLIPKWHRETGGLFLERYIHQQVMATLVGRTFDLVVVNGGDLVGPRLVRDLQRHCRAVINYNNDDPFGGRDRNQWRLYLQAIPNYDLVVVMREVNVQEAYALGAKRVLRVFMSADEVEHAPRTLTAQDYARWASEVLFVGTWMRDRGPMVAALIKAGLPLTIYGNQWQKSPDWPIIKPAWKGPAIYAADYVKAIQASKICIGFLSKGNRDLHTQRSLEVPFLGGLFCAERTIEHQQLYVEGEEAVFWSSPEECIRVCHRLLADEQQRYQIAQNGQRRAIKNNLLNEAVMQRILSFLLNEGPEIAPNLSGYLESLAVDSKELDPPKSPLKRGTLNPDSPLFKGG